MNLTTDQLSLIEEYASNLMTWAEISILLDIHDGSLIEEFMNKNSQAYRAYEKGKVKTFLAIRKNIVEDAKRGAPHSEVMALELINNQKINETDIL